MTGTDRNTVNAETTLTDRYGAGVEKAGWRPIETAPKDGTRILLGRFTGDQKARHEGLIKIDWYRTPESDSSFSGFGSFNPVYWPATHWMPLPLPPTLPTARRHP